MLNTSHKILIARILSKFVMTLRQMCLLSKNVIRTRGGIKWSLNLEEGIDLAIYLLGGFEVRTLHKYQKLVRKGNIVFDIGANIGAHTLPLAKLVGKTGKVIAFEPTQYAYNKLIDNINLNPDLKAHIKAEQIMIVNSDSDIPTEIYSSWPLENSDDLHVDHRGRLMSTQGATNSTLDHYVQSQNIQHVDFIKLDVDGNEYDVLMSGKETIRRLRPTLIMELAPFVYKTHPEKFDNMLKLLWELGYEITDISNGDRLPKDLEKIRALIPSLGSINSLATHYS